LSEVNRGQRQLNQALSHELHRLREGDVGRAALAVAWIAFLYGVPHAVGPGHGKLVISSLFVARDVRLRMAVGVSGLVSLLQTASAIGIVSVVSLALGRGGFDVLRDSRHVELVSYGLILLIGLVMLGGSLYAIWDHRHRRPLQEDPAALVMAVGMGLTVSLVGVLAIAVRRGTVRAARASPHVVGWVKELLGVAGAVAITTLGLVLFLAAWTSV
jgi:ABC-type nickel/cobalt efflux system permease component RcnA